MKIFVWLRHLTIIFLGIGHVAVLRRVLANHFWLILKRVMDGSQKHSNRFLENHNSATIKYQTECIIYHTGFSILKYHNFDIFYFMSQRKPNFLDYYWICRLLCDIGEMAELHTNNRACFAEPLLQIDLQIWRYE